MKQQGVDVRFEGKTFHFPDGEATLATLTAIEERIGWLDVVDAARRVRRGAEFCLAVVAGVEPEQARDLQGVMMMSKKTPTVIAVEFGRKIGAGLDRLASRSESA